MPAAAPTTAVEKAPKTKDRKPANSNRLTISDRLAQVLHTLKSEVESRITKRQPLEDRWLEDLSQYHGQYDTLTDKNLRENKGSRLFINLTRPKTDAMSAKLMDLLFPTDDRNWGIQPTPVPLLIEDAAKAVRAVHEIDKQLKVQQEQQAAAAGAAGADPSQPTGAPARPDPALTALEEEATVANRLAKELREIIEEANKRAEAMTAEIDDQLKASNYHAQMRDVIEDACKYGTGVCKGPVTSKTRTGWKKQAKVDEETGEEKTGFELDRLETKPMPAMRHVDIWNFFPDMDVRSIGDGEGDFERHLMNPRALRKLAKLPGFDKDAIRRLLNGKPTKPTPDFMTRIRDITNSLNVVNKQTYHVFEYSGPLSAQDVEAIAEWKRDEDTLNEVSELDPLDEVNVILWFCENEVLKLEPYPFDSGDTLYSVYSLIKDEGSVFGYGIPYVMRDPQRSLNAGWRAMIDNAALASGPQIIIAKDMIEPENGDWKLAPRKVWQSTQAIPDNKSAFQVATIPMMQAELANIVAISKQFIDDMTAMPSITQGEDASGPERTAQGTALLMNSANITFRRMVKAFDDDVTVPNITRFYDWNMQFSEKQEIKGDYGVDARGSSVLLVREMQAQNLLVLALQLGGHPVYGSMLKSREMLRKLFQSHMIPADEVLLSQEEIDAIVAQASQQAPDPMAEVKAAELELRKQEAEDKIEIANMDASTRVQVAQLAHQTAMMSLAEKSNMELDKLQAMLEKSRTEIESRERMFAAETAVTERVGPSGGGHF